MAATAKAPSWRGDKGTAQERGYTSKWRKARDVFLRAYPICEYCEARGDVTAANVVDHRTPHRGDQKLFWDRKNWAACCKRCHDSDKQRLEKSGVIVGCDEHGNPLDPNSHWFKT